MKDNALNEEFNGLIDAVVEWQLLGVDPREIDRAKIIDAARGVAYASGKSYFLERADSPPPIVPFKIDWYVIETFDNLYDAVEEMNNLHSESKTDSFRVCCLQKVEIGRRQ